MKLRSTKMKFALTIVATLLILFSCSGTSGTGYRDNSASEFSNNMQKPNTFLLDVRTKGEYETAYITGSTLIPVQELERRINELEPHKEKTILVYCRSGRRSVKASKILLKAGFTDVVNLKGGINGWKAAGLKTE